MSRTWIQLRSGGWYDLATGETSGIDPVVDIVTVLAHMPRFGAKTQHPWSVAQHAVLVADLVAGPYQEEALHHDDHEALLGDVVTPMKAALGQVYREMEDLADRAVRLAWKLGPRDPGSIDPVREADAEALELERQLLLAPSMRPWGSGHQFKIWQRASLLSLLDLTPTQVVARYMEYV